MKGLLAVADGKKRHAAVEQDLGAIGLPSSLTEAGPPEKITPWARRWNASSAELNGAISE